MLVSAYSFAESLRHKETVPLEQRKKKIYGINFLFFFSLRWREMWTDKICVKVIMRPPACLD